MTREEEKKIYETLERETWLNAVYEKLGMVAVEIEGDWKHDHLRTKWLMAEIGYKQVFETVTEEDGSDYYTAIHYFVKAH